MHALGNWHKAHTCERRCGSANGDRALPELSVEVISQRISPGLALLQDRALVIRVGFTGVPLEGSESTCNLTEDKVLI